MPRDSKEILLTGSTGFLGHYLLAELLRHPHVRCRVLLRPPAWKSRLRLTKLLADLGYDLQREIAAGRVAALSGSLPHRLELANLNNLHAVIHAAANTSFDADASGEPFRTNVEGTRKLLEVAATADVPRFVFVSTAYVCGRRTGLVPERLIGNPPDFDNDYERSKWMAEQLVWQWRGQSRISTICRPSVLFGDRATGRATSMKGLYLIARATELLARAVRDDAHDPHEIPLRILGRPDATVNVVPVCWAAQQIASIALEDGASSDVHHITNPGPPTHEQIKQWLEAYFDIGGGTFSNAAWPLDKPNHYEELFYSLGNVVRDYFRHDLRFESRRIRCENGPLIDRQHFDRCLRYAQATNWGRSTTAARKPRPCESTTDPRWYFEKFLPARIPKSAVARVAALTTVVRFVITGCKPGEWICRFDSGQLAEVRHGNHEVREEFGYRVTSEAFADLITGRKALQAVFFEGQAEMFGNIDRALKMVSIMRDFIEQFPVR